LPNGDNPRRNDVHVGENGVPGYQVAWGIPGVYAGYDCWRTRRVWWHGRMQLRRVNVCG
jgi:hypothetical protein